MNQQSLSSFIWSVADLLRGDYKQSEYGKVILPFTVLRRLDCVLESTKAVVFAELVAKQQQDLHPEPFLLRKAGQSFYNTSPLDMKKLMGDQDHIRENLFSYIQAFAPAVRDIFERFEFYGQIERLAKAGLLYLVTERFAQVDLHPGKISNNQMGLVFEEPQTAEILGALLEERCGGPLPNDPLFRNSRGARITRFGVRYILKKHCARARPLTPTLAAKRLHPHSMRHSTAGHLLRAGVDIVTISQWLGHASVTTTNRYATIDLEMKRKAIEQAQAIDQATSSGLTLWRKDSSILTWLEAL